MRPSSPDAEPLSLRNARIAPGPWSLQSDVRLVGIEIGGGRVQSVVDMSSLPAGSKAGGRVVDLEGLFVFPGFVDTHTHLGWAAEDFWSVPWDAVCNRGDALRAVEVVSRRIGDEFWVLGGDWLPAVLRDDDLPSLHELDAATGGKPLLLVSRDHSRAVLNTRALQLCRIDRHTPDPVNGRVDRDAEGDPTGRLYGEAVWGRLALGVVPPKNRHRQLAEMRALLADLVARGVTEVHDIGTFPRQESAAAIHEERSFTDVGILKELQARGELPIRVGYRPSLRRVDDFAELATRETDPDELVTFAGFKVSLDNGWFSDDPHTRVDSFRYPGKDETAALCAKADELGATVSIHAIGDLGVTEALDIIEGLRSRQGSRGPRHRLIHARRISLADIDRSARLGVALEVQPWEIVGAGRILLGRGGGLEFNRLLSPYRSMLDRGALVAFGSDRRLGMRLDLVDCDPLCWLQVAVTRVDPTVADDPSAFQPEERIQAGEAVACLTTNGAIAAGAGNRRGRIAAGFDADLVALSDNPASVAPTEIAGLHIEMTISAGRVVSLEPERSA